MKKMLRLVKGRGRDKDDRTTISLSSKGSRGSRMSLAEGLGSQGSVLASTPRRLVQSTVALDNLGSVSSYSTDHKDKTFSKLHQAALNGDLEKLKKQLKKLDINILDSRGRTPLHIAASVGHINILYHLVANGGAINGLDNEGSTPLQKAVEGDHIEAVQFLLDRGAHTDTQDVNGNTVCHTAVRQRNMDSLAVILRKGANPDIINQEGESPLHLAVITGSTQIVEVLLRNGALVNITSTKGVTPLMVAAKKAFRGIISCLIEFDADVSKVDEHGKTVLDYAKNEKVVDLLKELDKSGQPVTAFPSVPNKVEEGEQGEPSNPYDSVYHENGLQPRDQRNSEALHSEAIGQSDGAYGAPAHLEHAVEAASDLSSWGDSGGLTPEPAKLNPHKSIFDLSKFMVGSDQSDDDKPNGDSNGRGRGDESQMSSLQVTPGNEKKLSVPGPPKPPRIYDSMENLSTLQDQQIYDIPLDDEVFNKPLEDKKVCEGASSVDSPVWSDEDGMSINSDIKGSEGYQPLGQNQKDVVRNTSTDDEKAESENNLNSSIEKHATFCNKIERYISIEENKIADECDKNESKHEIEKCDSQPTRDIIKRQESSEHIFSYLETNKEDAKNYEDEVVDAFLENVAKSNLEENMLRPASAMKRQQDAFNSEIKSETESWDSDKSDKVSNDKHSHVEHHLEKEEIDQNEQEQVFHAKVVLPTIDRSSTTASTRSSKSPKHFQDKDSSLARPERKKKKTKRQSSSARNQKRKSGQLDDPETERKIAEINRLISQLEENWDSTDLEEMVEWVHLAEEKGTEGGKVQEKGMEGDQMEELDKTTNNASRSVDRLWTVLKMKSKQANKDRDDQESIINRLYQQNRDLNERLLLNQNNFDHLQLENTVTMGRLGTIDCLKGSLLDQMDDQKEIITAKSKENSELELDNEKLRIENDWFKNNFKSNQELKTCNEELLQEIEELKDANKTLKNSADDFKLKLSEEKPEIVENIENSSDNETIEELEKELKILSTSLREEQTKNCAEKELISDLEEKIKHLTTSLEHERVKNSSEEEINAELEDKIKLMSKRLEEESMQRESENEIIKELEDKISHLSSSLEDEKMKKSSESEIIEKLEDKVNFLSSSNEEEKVRNESLAEECEQLKNRLSENNCELDRITKDHKEKLLQEKEIAQRLQDFERLDNEKSIEFDELKKAFDAKQTELDGLNKQLLPLQEKSEVEAQNEQLRKELIRKEDEVFNINIVISSLREQIQQLKKEKEILEKEKERAEKESKQELAALSGALKEREDKIAELKAHESEQKRTDEFSLVHARPLLTIQEDRADEDQNTDSIQFAFEEKCQELSEMQTAFVELTNKYQQMSTLHEKCIDSERELLETSSLLRAQIEDLELSVKKMREELEILNAENGQLTEKNERLFEENDSSEQNTRELENNLKNLKRELFNSTSFEENKNEEVEQLLKEVQMKESESKKRESEKMLEAKIWKEQLEAYQTRLVDIDDRLGEVLAQPGGGASTNQMENRMRFHTISSIRAELEPPSLSCASQDGASQDGAGLHPSILDGATIQNKIDAINSQIQNHQLREKKYERVLSEHREFKLSLDQCQVQLESKERLLSEMKEQVSVSESRIKKISDFLEEQTKKVKALEERISSNEKEKTELTEKIEKALKENRDLNAKNEEALREKDDMGVEMKEAIKEKEDIKVRMENALQSKSELARRLSEEKGKVEKVVAEKERIFDRMQIRLREHETCQDIIQELREQAAEEQERKTREERNCQRLKDSIYKLESEIKLIKTQHDQESRKLRGVINNLETQIKKENTCLRDQILHSSRLKAELEQEKKVADRLGGELEVLEREGREIQRRHRENQREKEKRVEEEKRKLLSLTDKLTVERGRREEAESRLEWEKKNIERETVIGNKLKTIEYEYEYSTLTKEKDALQVELTKTKDQIQHLEDVLNENRELQEAVIKKDTQIGHIEHQLEKVRSDEELKYQKNLARLRTEYEIMAKASVNTKLRKINNFMEEKSKRQEEIEKQKDNVITGIQIELEERLSGTLAELSQAKQKHKRTEEEFFALRALFDKRDKQLRSEQNIRRQLESQLDKLLNQRIVNQMDISHHHRNSLESPYTSPLQTHPKYKSTSSLIFK